MTTSILSTQQLKIGSYITYCGLAYFTSQPFIDSNCVMMSSGRAVRVVTIRTVVVTVLLLSLVYFSPSWIRYSRVNHPKPVEQQRRLLLPWAGKFVSVSDDDTLLKLQWVSELRAFVETVQPRWPISILSASSEFTEMLLNWLTLTLVVIEEPIQNVLVVSLDENIHLLLKKRGFASLHISQDSTDSSDHKSVGKGVTMAGIARTTVMRLLLHWGYDVANYDLDALVIKNPQPLYDSYHQSDIVGTTAVDPMVLTRRWGFSVCFGAVMMRATYQTGTGYVTNLSVFVSQL